MTSPAHRARSVARLAAVQALYQMETAEAGSEAVIREFADFRFDQDIEGQSMAPADEAYFGKLVRGAVEHQARVDKAIRTRLAVGWRLERIDATLRAILRVGAFELIGGDAPDEVVIDEYVEIAKSFFDGPEPGFVNGALDESRAMSGPPDEFEWIARGLAPLAEGAPEAFGLTDDAAAIPSRPGFDLIVSKDAIVEGLHFLKRDPPDLVARKLLRVNLSDLAAKGAEPYGYFLAVAWPANYGWPERETFARGLAKDQAEFGLKLFGGDTVSTPGPFTASLTILGWTRSGRMVRRAGARVGDQILVSGTIGDGRLGLLAAKGLRVIKSYRQAAWLADRYRLPQPRLGLIEALREHAHAAADVSDGLIADAAKLAAASGVGLEIDLDRLPLSEPAAAWLAGSASPVEARIELATGGDDYEIVCAAAPENAPALLAAAEAAGIALAPIGLATEGSGVRVFADGLEVEVGQAGYVHH